MPELFEGVKLRIGRGDYVVPALTVRQLKQFRPVLTGMERFKVSDPSDEDLDQVLGMVHAALSRNYPDLTVEQLQDMVDLRSLPAIVKAIAGQTGLDRAQPGTASGE